MKLKTSRNPQHSLVLSSDTPMRYWTTNLEHHDAHRSKNQTGGTHNKNHVTHAQPNSQPWQQGREKHPNFDIGKGKHHPQHDTASPTPTERNK